MNIQGYATEQGSWIQGVAIRGDFLAGHKVLAYRDGRNGAQPGGIRVFWDDQEVLMGSTSFEFYDVKMHRDTGSKHLPSEEVLRKIFTKPFSRHSIGKVLGAWTRSSIYSIKLPQKVEVFLIVDTFGPTASIRKSIQVLINMPPKGTHGGWCGNFNGNENDESNSPHMEAVPSNQNWFAQAPDLPGPRRGGLLIDVPRNASGTGSLCQDEASVNQAAEDCAHLREADIRRACIEDICTARGADAAMEAADEIAIMAAMKGEEPKECEPDK